MPSAVAPLRTSRHLPASPTIGPVPPPPPPVVNVNESTSNSAPVPPAKVRYSVVVPAGAPVSVPVTLVNVSQPPVTGHGAEPSTVPVGEPARTWSVPPAPAEETRAVNDVALLSGTGRTRSSRRC